MTHYVASHVIRDTPDYIFEIDEYQNGAERFYLTHIAFTNFSPSILKRILREWKLFRSIVDAPLFAVRDIEDLKWLRFISRLGFKPHSEIDWLNGERRRLFIHLKEDNVEQAKRNPNQHQ